MSFADADLLPINTLSARVREGINQILIQKIGIGVTINDFKIVAGGCINHGGIIETPAGRFFIKWNDVHHLPNMFENEARGLGLLELTRTTRVPKVIGVGQIDSYQFIIIEFVSSAPESKTFWMDFGHQLAKMHQHSQLRFGLDHDNYIGSLTQNNQLQNSWIDFFIHPRLSVQLMLAEKSGLTDHDIRKKFETLFVRLSDLLPEGKPALLHGDLWSGNLIVDDAGNPCLIDPAVYYGNAEMELAYTKLFGGFNDIFFNAYNEIVSIDRSFEERIDLYNLYPLLVHTNLFGRSYLEQVIAIVDRFI